MGTVMGVVNLGRQIDRYGWMVIWQEVACFSCDAASLVGNRLGFMAMGDGALRLERFRRLDGCDVLVSLF